MPRFNPYAVVQRAVRLGLQVDSARRQLQRLGVESATAVVRELYPIAVEEFANQAYLETSSKQYVPLPEESMINRNFKEPWNNRYVMKVDFRDPITGELGSTELSINSNEFFSIEEAEWEMTKYATSLAEGGGGSDIPEGVEIIGSTMVNAFHNA